MCARHRPKRSHACIFSRIGVIITVRVDCFFFVRQVKVTPSLRLFFVTTMQSSSMLRTTNSVLYRLTLWSMVKRVIVITKLLFF